MSGPSFLCEPRLAVLKFVRITSRCLVLPLDCGEGGTESPLNAKVSSQMAPVRVDGRFAFVNPQVDQLTFYGLLWQV